ncbi:hypothetical protein FRX31_018287 [Thalictrum thalictroides]|uniref:Uncharacterized protein n=1 Tax=Thalictrum thalictroides TaxID=46969 RepID=A0A7J6W6G2_THATH|nr:hypothetical protein FRX31_018287 [Thalictrum thalictroides]
MKSVNTVHAVVGRQRDVRGQGSMVGSYIKICRGYYKACQGEIVPKREDLKDVANSSVDTSSDLVSVILFGLSSRAPSQITVAVFTLQTT